MDDFRTARVNLVNSAIVVCRLMHSVRLGVDSCFRDVFCQGHLPFNADSWNHLTGNRVRVCGMTNGRKLDQINPQKSAPGFEARGSNSAYRSGGVPSPVRP